MTSTNGNDASMDDFEPLMQAGYTICSANAVEDNGESFRFMVRTSIIANKVGIVDHRANETLPAFAIRYDGQAHAYLNRCVHFAMELDWQPGHFLH